VALIITLTSRTQRLSAIDRNQSRSGDGQDLSHLQFTYVRRFAISTKSHARFFTASVPEASLQGTRGGHSARVTGCSAAPLLAARFDVSLRKSSYRRGDGPSSSLGFMSPSFATNRVPDTGTLRMSNADRTVHSAASVLKESSLSRISDSLAISRPDGTHFLPLGFDRSCKSCPDCPSLVKAMARFSDITRVYSRNARRSERHGYMRPSATRLHETSFWKKYSAE